MIGTQRIQTPNNVSGGTLALSGDELAIDPRLGFRDERAARDGAEHRQR